MSNQPPGLKTILTFLIALITLPVLAQQPPASSFQVELTDSLKKAVRQYIKKQESLHGLSTKKHVIGVTLRSGSIPECYISATGKRINIREFPPLYVSKVDDYWIKFFILDLPTYQQFKYPEVYLKFLEENLLPLLEKESTAYPPSSFQQWRVIMPPNGPMDMKISL